MEALKVALEKTPGVGSKIDITLTMARIGIFYAPSPKFMELFTTSLTDAEALIDKGGDWDRRNRLKVYKGISFVNSREFKKAADLFVDALSTFTATELIDYDDLVALTVVTAMVSLGRVDLKTKVSHHHLT